MRGVWCQALSLPRPPVLWSGQPGFRDPCVPGAVGAGVGTQHRLFHSVRPCGPALLAVGLAAGRPRGGCFPPLCEGRLRSGAVPPPTARPLGGLLGPATHVLWAWVCGCGGPTLSPWPACPVGAVCRGGGGGPSPWGVACHRCEGRLVSGPVPPPAARPLERAARVPRPVCPGCGRCGRGDPALARQRAPLRAGIAGCGGGGRASPGGVPSTIVRGVSRQALSLPRLPAHWAGCWRPPPTCCGRGCVGVGVQHCPLSLHALWALRAAGVVGGRPRGGVACHRCEGRLVSGAVPPPAARPLEWAARVPRPVCPGCGRCGREDPAPAPQRAPLRAGIARCGGGGIASPGGVPPTIVKGVSRQALSLPQLPVHWVGCWGPPPTCCWRGCVGVGAQHCPLGLHALWGLRAAGVVGGRPRGGVACHRCEGRLVSGAVPPPATRPLERAARVPRPVCSGCGRCRRGDPAPARQHAPLQAGVARCGGGGRASPGGGAFHHCEGCLRSVAVPPPTARPLGGLLGSATHVLWARVCGCGGPTLSPRPACPVGAACRGGGGGPSPGVGGLPPL